MMKSPLVIFLSMMTLGSITAISASSWIMAWIGLEINMMGFIPLMSMKKNSLSTEMSMKYFMVSTIGSILMIFISTNSIWSWMTGPFSSDYFVTLPLMLKIGAAPTHSWLPTVSESLNGQILFLLLSWQKLGPLALISMTSASKMIMLFIIASATIGSISGLNQTSLKKLLAYSSISHLSWVLTAMLQSNLYWMLYFLIYSINLMATISSSIHSGVYTISQTTSSNKNVQFNLLVALLSLGGMPPFLGFLAKMIVITQTVNSPFLLLLPIMVLSSMINLYFYLKISYNYILLNHSNFKPPFLPHSYQHLTLIILISPAIAITMM